MAGPEPEPTRRKKPTLPGNIDVIRPTHATRNVEKGQIGIKEMKWDVQEPGTAAAVSGQADMEKAEQEPNVTRLRTPDEWNEVITKMGDVKEQAVLTPEQQIEFNKRMGKEVESLSDMTPKALYEAGLKLYKKIENEENK